MKKCLRFLLGLYFRYEIRGRDRLPTTACLIVGNHNCGAGGNPEALILWSEIAQVTSLSHDIIFRIPFLSFVCQRFGMVPAGFSSAKESLHQGQKVLVYPGGGWESCRPSSQRDRIDFKNRIGFAKLAQESQVPLVPVVAVGAHDGWYVWRRGSRMARALGLKKFFRIDVFPVGFALPFGFFIGAIWPIFPLPRKIILEILPPLSSQEIQKVSPADLAESVVRVMQERMNDLVKELPRSKRFLEREEKNLKEGKCYDY